MSIGVRTSTSPLKRCKVTLETKATKGQHNKSRHPKQNEGGRGVCDRRLVWPPDVAGAGYGPRGFVPSWTPFLGSHCREGVSGSRLLTPHSLSLPSFSMSLSPETKRGRWVPKVSLDKVSIFYLSRGRRFSLLFTLEPLTPSKTRSTEVGFGGSTGFHTRRRRVPAGSERSARTVESVNRTRRPTSSRVCSSWTY